jgi:hypothetical protein
MRLLAESQLGAVLSGLPGSPRVVAGGNFATPRRVLAVLDSVLAEYRLFVLNGQPGLPDRDGVILETPFVGPGMRGKKGLRYFPSRLSLVPHLLKEALLPDVVVVQTSVPVDGTISLGIEVNVLPAAIEAVRATPPCSLGPAPSSAPTPFPAADPDRSTSTPRLPSAGGPMRPCSGHAAGMRADGAASESFVPTAGGERRPPLWGRTE